MRRIHHFITFLILITVLNLTASASDNASVTVDFSVDQHSRPIAGAAFSLAKLMDHQGGSLYLTSDAKRLGVTKEEILKDAGKTGKRLQGKISAQMTLKTGADGIVTFAGLEDGVYLIWMSGREKEALDYKEAAPAIVTLPCWEKGTLMHNQTIYPKTSKSPEKEPEENQSYSVRTGDDSAPVIWFCLLMAAGMTILNVCIRKRGGDFNA